MDVGDEKADLAERRSSGSGASEGDEIPAQIIVFYPKRSPMVYRLYSGVNVIGRRSSFPERDVNRLQDWKAEYSKSRVHGIFLESSSVSSAHAAIYLEPYGDLCFVKDLKSRNKTFLKKGGSHMPIPPMKKAALHSGGMLTFGALKCRVSFGATYEGIALSGASSPTSAANTGFPRSIAMDIELNAAPENATPGSLDKCPSLQEWFVYPKKSNSPVNGQPSPFGASQMQLNLPELAHRHSFGFDARPVDRDEHTSSDAEPETPRVDRRPAPPPRLKSVRNPIQDLPAGLAPMIEDDDEGDGSGDTNLHQPSSLDEQESMQLGAETLAKLKVTTNPPTGPALRGSMAGEPPKHDSNQADTSKASQETGYDTPSISPAASLTEEEIDASGRTSRSKQKSPNLKRSRSGRGAAPERLRSKSPRLQRGFLVQQAADRREVVQDL